MNSKSVKIHRPIYRALHEILTSIFIEKNRTPATFKRFTSQNRKWGGRDRRVVAEITYECVRWWRRLYEANGNGWDDSMLGLREKQNSLQFTEQDCLHCLNLYLSLKGFEVEHLFSSRSYNQQTKSYQDASAQCLATLYSLSDELFEMGSVQLGEAKWLQTLEALNQPAIPFLRVNTLKLNSAKELMQSLSSEGYKTSLVEGCETALRLDERKNVFVSKSYKNGEFEMQDAASQQVAPLLNLSSKSRVIDACAGAGGKSLHLSAELQGKGKILALDITQWKLDELKKRAKRAGAQNIETRLIESSKTLKRLQSSADALLLDVPCSGSGVIRRNPDPKWRLGAEDLQSLMQKQVFILKEYSKLLKPGGQLVYSTCSVLPSENSLLISQVLNEHLQGYELQKEYFSFPQERGFDGFYAAVLKNNQ